jgi:hypothetical protein
MQINNWYIISPSRNLCEHLRFFQIVLSGVCTVAIQIGLYQTYRGVRIIQPYLHLKQAYLFAHTTAAASGGNLNGWVNPTVRTSLNPLSWMNHEK